MCKFGYYNIEKINRNPKSKFLLARRKGVSKVLTTPTDELSAVVSDFKIFVDIPTFNPNEISKIVRFIKKLCEDQKEKSVTLKINGGKIVLNQFVQNMFKSVIKGLVAPLRKEEKKLGK